MTEKEPRSPAELVVNVDTPNPVVLLKADVLARAADLVRRARVLRPKSQESLKTGDAVNASLRTLKREIETARKDAKGPFLKAGRMIDDAVGDVVRSINEATSELSGRLLEYADAEARRAAEVRRAQEAAERAEREAAEKADALRRAENVAQGRDTTTEAPKDALAESLERLGRIKAAAALGRAGEAESAATPPKVSSVHRRTIKVLVVDLERLPKFKYGPLTGDRVPLVKPDEVVIRKLLEAGVEIPGARLVEETIVASSRKS